MSVYQRPLRSDELMHWGKGQESKVHKYVAKIGNRYFYSQEELQAYKKAGQDYKKASANYDNAVQARHDFNNSRNLFTKGDEAGKRRKKAESHINDRYDAKIELAESQKRKAVQKQSNITSNKSAITKKIMEHQAQKEDKPKTSSGKSGGAKARAKSVINKYLPKKKSNVTITVNDAQLGHQHQSNTHKASDYKKKSRLKVTHNVRIK